VPYRPSSSPSTGGSPGPSPSSSGRLLALLYLTLITSSALWIMWQTVPPQRRAMTTARLFRSSARATRLLARRTAALSMVNELATGGAVQEYGVPLWLSLRAESLDRRAREAVTDA
jgi:hypothetical protein